MILFGDTRGFLPRKGEKRAQNLFLDFPNSLKLNELDTGYDVSIGSSHAILRLASPDENQGYKLFGLGENWNFQIKTEQTKATEEMERVKVRNLVANRIKTLPLAEQKDESVYRRIETEVNKKNPIDPVKGLSFYKNWVDISDGIINDLDERVMKNSVLYSFAEGHSTFFIYQDINSKKRNMHRSSKHRIQGNKRFLLAKRTKRTVIQKTLSCAINIETLSCGYHHVMFLSSFGKVYGYGSNKDGQLSGYQKEKDYFDEAEVLNEHGTGVESIVCRYNRSLVARGSSSSRTIVVLCLGEIRKRVKVKHNCPNMKLGLIKSLMCGRQHGAILLKTGDCFTFGSNTYGQIGCPFTKLDFTTTAYKINSGLGALRKTLISQVGCFDRATVFLTQKGHIYYCGVLGAKIASLTTSPVLLHATKTFTYLSCGEKFGLAICAKKEVI